VCSGFGWFILETSDGFFIIFTYGLFYDAVGIHTLSSDGTMTQEFETIWKEAVMAYFNIISLLLPETFNGILI
jgi:hypothetical protein